MTIAALDATLPPCVKAPEHFGGETTSAIAIAHRQCAGCPLFVECLYRAVVEVDISGFVACTTEADRAEIRSTLGIRLTDQNLELGLARNSGSPINHAAVVAARQAHPHDTSQQLAERLGCSTSTIKRHLRKARENMSEGHGAVVSARTSAVRRPSIEEVLDVFDSLESSKVA